MIISEEFLVLLGFAIGHSLCDKPDGQYKSTAIPVTTEQELLYRQARTKHENPPRPEIRKKYHQNYNISHPELGPENLNKSRKNTNMARKGPFLYLFGNFSCFRGPTRGWGFCFFCSFFVFPAFWGVFVLCTSSTESQSKSQISFLYRLL